MIDLGDQSLLLNIGVLIAGAVVILLTGTKLARIADRLADRTGLGEAVTGSLFLGLTTALPGLSASITAALEGYPALAISNAIGGIAIQTTFLAVADIFYKKANLEHAAASLANMVQTAILIILLTLVLLGLTSPETTVGDAHPATYILFIAAGFGFWLVFKTSKEPMWFPRKTKKTVEDEPEEENIRANLWKLIAGFFLTAVAVTIAGSIIAHTSANIATETGLSETVAGGLLSGVATSLPELVTTVAAVRQGALTLAVSDIVGGNFYDVLFLVAADFVFLEGSIYHAAAVSGREVFLTGLVILLNILLLLGLLSRQRSGPGNIGFESFLILLCYLGGFVLISQFM